MSVIYDYASQMPLPNDDTLAGEDEPLGTSDWHVVATASRQDERTRVLMRGDTFGLFDLHGDIAPGGLGEQGLYCDGTRHLSKLVLELGGRRPFFLGSPIRDKSDQLTVAMTNPDIVRNGVIVLPRGTLHLKRTVFLLDGVGYHQLELVNHGLVTAEVSFWLVFTADYADIFEVRGGRRRQRGLDLAPEVGRDRVVLSYQGLDGVQRRTVLGFTPEPTRLGADRAKAVVKLAPRASAVYRLTVACERRERAVVVRPFEEARRLCRAHVARDEAWSTQLQTSNPQFDVWKERTFSDLRLLTNELPTGPYPYAGVPWFNTPIGRDGLVTGLESLWIRPALARGVLTYLASTQATEDDPTQDAEPGKILHEVRRAEMAAVGEMPFGRYYGSVDATPLFVYLAAAFYDRTGDREFAQSLWPHVQSALAWMDHHGDRDGDGFVEYERRSGAGLVHQGWKDSDDAVFHADGSLAGGPIALCEVQAYVYAARRAGARLAAVLGHDQRAAELEAQAEALSRRFDEAFWSEELQSYALALDGDKRPCLVRSSNAGQCLFSGIVPQGRAQRLVHTLLHPDSFTGWGVRTIASSEARYNPMSYHNGSIWPHDNALVALGLARYGFGDEAVRLLDGLFDAAMYFDLQRMPELFCGFAQEPGEGPVLYPVACAPQAWSCASMLLLLQAVLGLEVDGPRRQVHFTRPRLPERLRELKILNLQVADASVDLLLVRHARDVGVDVLQRNGDVRVVVVK
jgi:glycogen debranching enzyme